jgi:hypothetical protein
MIASAQIQSGDMQTVLLSRFANPANDVAGAFLDFTYNALIHGIAHR